MIYILLLVGATWLICKISTEIKLENYDMSKVDTVKLSMDEARGVTVAERRRRCIKRYYDKK